MQDLFALGGGFVGLLICCVYLFIFIGGILLTIFWVWMLIDVITRSDQDFGKDMGENARLIWLLIILFTGWVGTLIYYFLVYKKHPHRNK